MTSLPLAGVALSAVAWLSGIPAEAGWAPSSRPHANRSTSRGPGPVSVVPPPDSATQSPLTLWYRQPATTWNEALPVGNGRLGAMVFGGVQKEHIQLNEETLWTGGPYNPVVKGAFAAVPEIQRLLFADDVPRANDLFGRTMMGVP